MNVSKPMGAPNETNERPAVQTHEPLVHAAEAAAAATGQNHSGDITRCNIHRCQKSTLKGITMTASPCRKPALSASTRMKPLVSRSGPSMCEPWPRKAVARSLPFSATSRARTNSVRPG